MALRWIEGFETWGNLNDTQSVWQDQFYGKYARGHCDYSVSKLVAGYLGIGLGWYNNSQSYNFLTMSFESRQVWTIGFAFRIPTSVYYSGENIVRILDDNTNQLNLVVWRDMGSGTNEISIRRGSTILNSLGFYTPDDWIFIEVQCTIDNTVGAYECRVNGATVCSATNVDTSYSGNAYVNAFFFGLSNGTYDDIYILDDTTGQDDFLGIVKAKRLLPTSDSSVQWARSTGANNYANVDEVPVSTTDYNYSKTQYDTDLFGFADSPEDVLGAHFSVDAKLSAPGGMKLTLVCDSNSTQETEDEQLGDAELPTAYSLVIDTDPDTSALWTKTGFNAATWGVKVG